MKGKKFASTMPALFEDDWGVDESPLDNTEITTMLLYFSTEQQQEFKELCKSGIKSMFGEDYQQKGNLPVFLLTLLREKYGDREF